MNGTVVTFTPTAPLPGNKQIFVSVSGVRDLAGNAVSRSSSFTTGIGTDATPPQIVSITPNDKAVGIGINTPIVLTFSESLNSTTVNNNNFALFVNGSIVRPSVSRSQDNRTVSLSASLPPSSVISVIVTNDVQDLSGNPLSDFVSVFTTAPGIDSNRPSVSRIPGSGASNVLSDASIVLYTSERMNESSLQPALHIAQNGQLVGGTITLSANGQALVFKPLQPWAANALVEIFLNDNAEDINGNALNTYQSSFRVAADTHATAPSVVATQPSYGSNSAPVNPKIDLQYSEALDATTVNTTTVVFHDYSTGQVLPSSVSLIKGGQVIRIVPQAQLTVSHTYYVQTVANSIKDLDGQAASGYFLYFVTSAVAGADTQAPKVIRMSPPGGSTNVGINGHVHVLFDEPINPISLLSDQQTTTYGSLFWSDTNRNLEFVRHQPYAVNTQITESVAGMEDAAGNSVSTPNSVTFTAGSGPDFTPPQDTDHAPFTSATNVPVNAVIKIGFNEPIDPVSVNASTTYLYDTQTGEHLAGSMALDVDGRTIVYVPSQALAVGRAFYAYAYGVKDLSGNLRYTYLPFTTAFAADAQAPVITKTSIADGLTNISTNANLEVAFDEPINDLTLSEVSSP